MKNSGNYQDDSFANEITPFEGGRQYDEEKGESPFDPLLRRWVIIVVTFTFACMISVPAVCLFVNTMYDTEGAIMVSPIERRILFSDSEFDSLPNYGTFLNTQAELIGSNNILNRVADDLIDRELEIFAESEDLVMTLKKALVGESIKIKAGEDTELIKITMTSEFPEQAEQVVDAFIRAYMSIVVSEEVKGDDRNLSILEEKRKVLYEQVKRQRTIIRQLAEEFGTAALTDRQKMMLQQVMSLQDELTNARIKKLSLEAEIEMRKSGKATMTEGSLMERRNQAINRDISVKAITENIIEYEEMVVMGKQSLTANNPELLRRIEVLESMKKRLEEQRAKIAKEFDDGISEELSRRREQKVEELTSELSQADLYQKSIEQQLKKQNSETIEMGRKQLAINDQQEELDRLKSTYDAVCQRISELDMERKRPARITVAYQASSVSAQGKKLKLLVMSGFGAMAFAIAMALLRDKTDKSLHSTEDVVKRLGMRIIGTTTNPRNIDGILLEQRLNDDYQTIRANLELLDMDKTVKIIVVTSPGMGDGKTTCSMNLAISFAQSKKKVLLIDGDMRKPEIANTLKIPQGTRGLQDLLFGMPPEETIFHVSSIGIDVLAADCRNAADAIDLLTQGNTANCIKDLSKSYDYVIIDTPPVLAFSDALLWSLMSDAVIMASFAKHTSRVDLRLAIERVQQTGTRVLGTVLHNVKTTNSYHRYGYDYYSYGGKRRHEANRMDRSKLLLPSRD